MTCLITRVRHAALLALVLITTTACSSTRPAATLALQSAILPAPACADDAGWDDPVTPRRIFGNTYYVGTCGISAVLVVTDAGHAVIDGGTARGGELVLANIRALGFDPADIRYVLNTHAHVDHAGGLATLQRASGATVLAHGDAVATLQRGRSDASDPQSGSLPPFPPVSDVTPITDGHAIKLGDVELVAHATPGHAAGGTSWTWRACEAVTCRRMAFVDSLSAVSDAGYRFSAQPALLATFRGTFDRVAALPCDILVTPHPAASRLWQRIGPGATDALVDVDACRRYADGARARLATRLDDEATGRAR